MKFKEVCKEDLDMCLGLQSLLKGAEIKVSPADCVQVGRIMEWVKLVSRELGLLWKLQSTTPAAPPPSPAPEEAPQLQVLQYNPGEI